MPLFSRVSATLLFLLVAPPFVAAPQRSLPRVALPVDAGDDPARYGRPSLRVFTDKDGLPQNAVGALVFDREGYLWAATKDGAARYDGRVWSVVNMPREAGTNSVTAVVAASDGSFWFGTNGGGLAHLEGSRWTLFDETNSPLGSEVNALLETVSPDGQPILLAGTNEGLARFERGTWQREPVLSGASVTCMLDAASPNGERTIWVGTLLNGVARMAGDEWTVFDESTGLPVEGVISLAETTVLDGRRFVVAGTFIHGLLLFDGARWRRAEGAFGAVDGGAVHALVEARAQGGAPVLWAGTSSGIRRFEGGRWHRIGASAGVPPAPIWTLARVDSPAGTVAIWAGTAGLGIVHWQLGRWTAFDTSTGLVDDSVYSLLVTEGDDGLSVVWVGTNAYGLSRFENGTWTHRNGPAGFNGPGIGALAETTDADGGRVVWVGAGSALLSLEDGRWTTYGTRDGLIPPVNALLPTAAAGGGEAVWVGTNKGLFRVERGEVRRADPALTLPDPRVSAILETEGRDGTTTLWLGTPNGLARFENGATTVYDARTGLLGPSVTSLHEHRSRSGARTLWVGTTVGLAILELDVPSASWSYLSTASVPALPNNTIYRIEEDARGRVYLFTNKGVARLAERAPTADDPARFDLYTFTTSDGLPSNECNTGASTVDAYGRIWAGTIAGAAVFDPSREIEDATPRPLVLSRAHLPDRSRPLASGASLAHDENRVLFEVALLSYFREDETRYRAQLVGYDETPSNWSPEFRRDYISLPPGDYTFRAWGRDALGNVSGPVEIPFTIRRAPWLTWWAMVLYAIAILGIAYEIFKYRVRSLRRRNEQLETRIAERTTQLAHTVEELRSSERRAQEANHAKSAFLANMSHELRTPLNAILGFVQLMERDGALVRSHRESLGIISRSGEHLLGLINDVLSIAKIESGKVDLVEQDFDLHELVRTALEMTRARAEAKGLAVEMVLGPAVPAVVRGDGAKLRQVLVNLLGNAVKFTEAGTITLRAAWEDDGANAGCAAFEVIDTGCGIDEKELGRLFEAFVQTESGARAREGTGLGLVISRTFVRLMGGDLHVTSAPGVGTTFRFDVALRVTSQVDRRTSARRRAVGLAGEGQPTARILVVDDVAENRLLLVRLLEEIGFEVREATNGREGVAMWESWRPHMIWMDMRMPVMDGLEATSEIRRRERALLPPGRCIVVALTASAFEHEREKFLHAGCDDFVPKPFEAATVLEKIAQHLGVRYVYAESAAEADDEGDEALDGLEDLPAALVEPLRAALLAGDPRAAMQSIERVREHESAMAERLAAYVRSYRFDEILDRIES